LRKPYDLKPGCTLIVRLNLGAHQSMACPS
jgi:hypothetical protein